MDLKKLFLATFLLFAFTSSAFAGILGYNSSDAQIGSFSELKCGTGITCTSVAGKMLMELQGADGPAIQSNLSTNDVDAANSVWGESSAFVFEGATADAYETRIKPTDATADRDVTLPDQSGTVMLSATASAITVGTTPTITVAPGNRLFTDTITTDNQDQTIGVSGVGAAGDQMRIIFVTDSGGSNDEVITFGTNIRSTGTLTLANAAASRYVVSFVSDGTKWNEVSRTAVQAA